MQNRGHQTLDPTFQSIGLCEFIESDANLENPSLRSSFPESPGVETDADFITDDIWVYNFLLGWALLFGNIGGGQTKIGGVVEILGHWAQCSVPAERLILCRRILFPEVCVPSFPRVVFSFRLNKSISKMAYTQQTEVIVKFAANSLQQGKRKNDIYTEARDPHWIAPKMGESNRKRITPLTVKGTAHLFLVFTNNMWSWQTVN